MLLERTNLQREMELLPRKEMKEQEVLEEVKKILKREENSEEEILRKIAEGSAEESISNPLVFDLLQTEKIYHENQIKKICVDFRLRFLDTKFFKGDLPAEALSAVKEVEKKHGISLQGFKIVAPAKYFRLENADDPMLFAPLGNGYYYLLHKWGTDMHPLRKLLMWPLKNL